MMTNDEQLIGVTLGGFQVFDKPTHIPFGKLTFLYGPNSAGKSAVEDALKILSEIWAKLGSTFDIMPGDRWPRLQKDWRRTGNVNDTLSKELVVAAVFEVSTRMLANRIQSYLCEEDHVFLPAIARDRLNLELRCTFVAPDDFNAPEDSIDRPARHIDVIIDGESLVMMREGSECTINARHPTISLPQEFDVEFPEIEVGEVSIEASNGRWRVCGEWVRVTDDHYFDIEFTKGTETPVYGSDIEANQRLLEFKRVFDAVIAGSSVAPKNVLSAKAIPASRKVPDEQDLLFLISVSGIREMSDEDEELKKRFGIAARGNPLYFSLARSMAAGLVSLEGRERSDAWYGVSTELGERVNHALGTHLFIERGHGYRLAMDYRLLLSPDEYRMVGQEFEGADEKEMNYWMLVRLFLEDAAGRQYAFEDVGSGLGYVLPVLAGLFERSGGVIVQQPELHLHPALQAALGDVFIEASNYKDGPIIVETHSEHLLLRVLRRVRQSRNKDRHPIDSTLQIGASDLSIVYFNPDSDGVTKVKRLRVSDEGEFLDRWPRGFFAERDQELFDDDE